MVTIENNCFSIPQICESGQCFRLDAVSEDTYELLAGSRYLKIGIRENLTEAAGGEENAYAHGEPNAYGETILYCTQEEYETFWKEYFDLSASYSDYIARIDRQDDYLKSAAEFGSGIRILRQDTWEMIITFILSQQNNIPRIKGLIRTLCERYGERCVTPDGRTYDTFPRAEDLAQATEEELRELKLGYRTSIVKEKGYIVLAAVLELQPGDREEIRKLMEDLKQRRGEKQPLDMPSAGSTFKRPEGYFAGKLIMDAGLRGFSVGGAQISEKHCGFVVNTGKATANDVLTLIREVQKRVRDKFGVELETEVKFLGEF